MRFLNKIANFLNEAEKASKSLNRISADIADSVAQSTAEYTYKSKEDTFKKLLFYSVLAIDSAFFANPSHTFPFFSSHVLQYYQYYTPCIIVIFSVQIRR